LGLRAEFVFGPKPSFDPSGGGGGGGGPCAPAFLDDNRISVGATQATLPTVRSNLRRELSTLSDDAKQSFLRLSLLIFIIPLKTLHDNLT